MTQQMPPLNYATPMLKPRSSQRYLPLAAAIAVGVLGANTFADAAGFAAVVDAEREPGHVFVRVVCGVILAFLAAVIVSATMRSVAIVGAILAQTRGRPVTAVAITLITSGALCLLGAAAIPLCYVRNSPASFSLSAGSASSVTIGTPLPILCIVATIITIAVGMALAAIGIWGSLPEAPRA